ncbi:MAG TPA: hypothetical protein DDZ76_14140 [Xanthomonadales bacterium]|nr:hypothetical protein [Xanthomonadales bacterium]
MMVIGCVLIHSLAVGCRRRRPGLPGKFAQLAAMGADRPEMWAKIVNPVPTCLLAGAVSPVPLDAIEWRVVDRTAAS